jgi:hypothetical protein
MGAISHQATLKVERANEHIAHLRESLVALEKTYTSHVELDPKTGLQNLIHTVPSLATSLQKLSLIAGDAVHNLRSALDIAWFETLERIAPATRRNFRKFPVRQGRKELEAALKGIKIQERCPALYTMMVSTIKPYISGDNSVLGILHNLDIEDKHILPLQLGTWAEIRGVIVAEKNGYTASGSGMPVQSLGPYVISFPGDFTIKNHGKLFLTITVKKSSPFYGMPVAILLPGCGEYVFHAIKLLATV